MSDDTEECQHPNVETDDDGLNRKFWVCTVCNKEVQPVGDDEWETVE
jgi:hypothetical protein